MTATLLPNAKSQFFDGNGKPLAGGSVYFYIPNTSTKKDTYQDSAQTILNTNPITLDASGEAIIWGSGSYRQVVYDQYGNLVWDQITQGDSASLLGNIIDQKYVAGADFTPGVTTQLTLPSAPGSVSNTWIFFDAAYQADDQVQSINGLTLTFNSPIPLGTQEVNVKIGTTLAIGTPGSGTVSDSSLAQGNRVYNRAFDTVWVTDFGAKGDGITDDTAKIIAADSYARSKSPAARLFFPSGVYMVSQLPINTNTNWFGEGRSTIIRQITGSNKDLLYGVNSNTNWGSSSPSGFPYNITIKDIYLDGNHNGGSGNTSGGGFVVYGDRFDVENLYIYNVAGYGMRTEYVDSSIDYGQPFYESTFRTIRIDTTGDHGWLNNGPHDMHMIDVSVLDAGQSANNTADGLQFGAKFSGRLVACHAATRSGSLRMRYAFNCQPGSIGEVTGGSQIEGAYTACLGLFSSQWEFDPSTRYYAAWNGVTIYLGGTNCSLNILKGYIQGTVIGQPPPVGIQFSTTTGDHVNNNEIDVVMTDQSAGAINFTAQDSGFNKIRAFVWTTANVGINGTPNVNDDIIIQGQINNGSHFEINSKDQIYSVVVPGSGTYTLNWNYPFYQAPVVSIAPINVPSNTIQINSRSATQMVLSNGSASAVVCDVRAKCPF